MASTAFSAPGITDMLTDDIDLLTPKSETFFLEEVISAVGEGSQFEATHGFYVERIGSWVLLSQPRGWMERALVLPHPTLTIRVLHPLDLLYNKLEVCRRKDLAAAAEILGHGSVAPTQIEMFVQNAEVPAETKAGILKNLNRILQGLKTAR